MRLENKRIFIKDLPETATQEEIETAFTKYGKVSSVEIKERKQLTALNKSLFFAYVDIEITDNNLQKCFEHFRNNVWHESYVELQIAKENFLERLKREREANAAKKDAADTQRTNEKMSDRTKICEENEEKNKSPKRKKITKQEESSESESDSDEEKPEITETEKNGSQEEELDLIIKNNKGKTVNKNGLKIDSFGKEPIVKMEPKNKQNKQKLSETDQKRLDGLKKIISEHKQKQALIKNALANVDAKRKNKIIFDDIETTERVEKPQEKPKNKNLFEDEDEFEENETYNFEVKTKFGGKRGQELLALQSKFKNDKRFAMDERFLEEDKEGNRNDQENKDDDFNIQEKNKQFEILESVLGKKVKNFEKVDEKERKKMLRFDPLQPEHSKFEMKTDEGVLKKKKKKEKVEQKIEEAPEVSKEIFYQVQENVIKEALESKQQFSLLSQFGKSEETLDEEENENKSTDISKNLSFDKNPFRYDSSDEEEEVEKSKEHENKHHKEKQNEDFRNFWNEPFFFKDDDYRMQEGLDFVRKLQTTENEDFQKIRREVKGIARAKVRNSQRNNRPFKKKLGGNKRRKIKRIKKALNR